MVNARGGAKTAIKTTELDVSGEGTVRACADKALKMLQEGRVDKVTFIGVGLQVNKAVAAVELVKKKITGVHQCTTYAPVQTKNAKATQIRIDLAMKSAVLDVKAPGYQSPDSESPSPRKRKATKRDTQAPMPMKKKVAHAFNEASQRQERTKNAVPPA